MLSWIKNRKENSDQNQNTEEDKNIDQGEKNQINDEESKLFFLTEKKLDYSKKTSDECTDCKKKKNNELEETKICICDCCNVNRIQNYSDYFNFAIESNEVKNLAILGEYGVGKSSIFKSFLYNFDKQKYKNSFIEIEVGQYHKNNINKDDKDDKDFNETKYVQKQILIQIATQVKSKKIKSSNYNLSLFNLKRWQIFLFAILVLVTIIFSTFFSISLTDYIKNANKITQALVKTNEAQLEHSWTQGWSLTTIIIFGIISIFLIGIIFVLIRRYLNKIKFTFSFFSQKIEMEFYKQGIFQETDIRISEILDIFKTLWKKEGKFIYVFEDIDRFGNTFILQKLKELNKNINNFLKNNKPWIDELEDECPRIKKILKQFEKWIKYFQICTRKSNYNYPNKIIFVYLVTPKLFDLDEKVKFFDLAIPIVPITSKGKASEFWFQNFENVISKLLKLSKEEVNNKYKKNVDWHKYFLAISETVHDIRSILNILNEFTIYFKLFYSNVESKNMEILIFRLLSFIIFKNVFYNEYISIWNLKLKDLRRIQNDNNERYKWKTSYFDLIWKEISFINSKYNILEKINKDKLENGFEKWNELQTFNDNNNKKWNVDIYYFLNFILCFSYKTTHKSYYLGILNFTFKNLPNNLYEFSGSFFTKLTSYAEKCKKYPFPFSKLQMENNKKNLTTKKSKNFELDFSEKNIENKNNENFDYVKIVEFMLKVNKITTNRDIISPDIIFNFLSIDSSVDFSVDYFSTQFQYLKHEFSIKRLEYQVLYKEIIEAHFEQKINWENKVSKEIDLSVIFLKLMDIDFELGFISNNLSIDTKSLTLWFIKLLTYIQDKKNEKIIQNIFWILPPIAQWMLLLCVDIIYNELSDIEIREKINITFTFNKDNDERICLLVSKRYYVSKLLHTVQDHFKDHFKEGEKIVRISKWAKHPIK